MKIYDAIVVGMGPAGLTAARFLADGGADAALVEKETFPRYKPCGGCISPRASRMMPAGVHKAFERTIHQVRFTFRSTDEFFLNSSRPIAYMAMRDRLDEALFENLKKEKIEIFQGAEVKDARREGELVSLNTSRGILTARNIIAADGSNSIIANRFGLGRKRKFIPTITAEIELEEEIVSEWNNVWIDLDAVKGGYFWIFPKKRHLTVGAGIFKHGGKARNLKEALEKYIGSNALLAKGIPRSVKGHLISVLLDESDTIADKGVFLTGDAAGLTDPFMGEGIPYAIRSGELAAKSILDGAGDACENYYQAVKREILPGFKVAAKLSGFVFSFPKIAHKLLKDHAVMANFYEDIFQGSSDYTGLFDKVREKIKTSYGVLAARGFDIFKN